jgi:hypothetical protein
VPTFAVIVVGWRRNDGDARPINSSSTLGKAILILKAINNPPLKQLL